MLFRSGGIGTLLCRALKKEGAMIVGIDRVDCPEADQSVLADLGSFDGITALGEKLGGMSVDMLVNLAGIQYFGPFHEQSP